MDILSQEITIVIIASAFLLLIAIGIVVLFLVYQKKQLQHILQKNELQRKFENEVLNVQIETQEHTLNLVGLEIHDNVGQILSLAKLNLNKVPDQNQSTVLQSTKELIDKAIQDLRTISKTLNSNYISQTSLAECLRFDLSIINQSGVIKTTLHIEGDEVDLNSNTKLIVYRITQELLNNAIKHSGASAIKVVLTFSGDHLKLCVEDNGKGMAMAAGPPKGTGLSNLYTRAKMIGGELTLSQAVPQGLKAELVIHALTSAIVPPPGDQLINSL